MKEKRKWTILALGAFVILLIAHFLYYQKSKITIYDDNTAKKINWKPGLTVGEFLQKNNISLGQDDLTNPATDFPLIPGSKIYLNRSHSEVVISTISIHPELIEQKKEVSNLRPVLVRKYRYGKRIIQEKILTRGGRTIRREKISEKTFFSTFKTLTLLDKETLKPVKTYNLTRCRKIKMIATAYYPGDPLAWKNGTETFLGLKMERGIVAVDPKVIKLRSRVYVPGYGYGYAADTGSAIKGKRIDLGVTNAEEEKEWPHRPVVVYILEAANNY